MSVINLGIQGENNARQIQLDISRLATLFGAGTAQLLHRRPGDDGPYPVAVVQSGNAVTWTVTSSDTEFAGEGQAELQYFVGDTLAKTESYTTTIAVSLGEAGDVPPAPQAGWVTQVLQAGSNAAEAAERAENAVLHPPIIGENGNWWLWSFTDGVYADSGTSALGSDASVTADNIKAALGFTPADAGALPTKTSQLTNDNEFITKAVSDLESYYLKSETLTKAEVNALVSAIPKFSIQVVSALPTSGISSTTVYLVKDGTDGNLYTEYIYVSGAWEILGSQRVDLTGYATEVFVRDYAQPKGDYALRSELPSVVQVSGDSTTAVMSQQAVSKALDDRAKNEDVFDLTRNALFVNVFDTIAIEYGKILNSDGSVSDTAAGLATTDFISVKTGDVIRMADFALYREGTPRIGIYNASKGLYTTATATSIKNGSYYLTNPEVDANGDIVGFTIDHLANGGYIIICTNTSVVGNNPILTINEEIAYEDGYGSKLNERVKVDFSQVVNAPGQNGWSILPDEHLNICYSGINRKPINTVEHFVDAAENFGYNALKCDVRPTSDGELVCCHDAGLTFDSSGYITAYDSGNQTLIRNVTAATCLGYSFKTGEHPCLVGDFLDVCRKYGKIAFITIRNEYMDVVIHKLLEELRVHNMTYASIINCMTYESLVQWRAVDKSVMINYTLNYGVAIDQTQIDRAVGLGYCSLCGFSLSSASTTPSASCDFEYARANGIRLLEAIAYKEGSPEACYDLGYDGCQIGIPWNPKSSGGTVDAYTKAEIDSMFGSYVTDIDTLLGGES